MALKEGATLRILVTGGAGFIGSAVVDRLLAAGEEVLNVDSLTYAANGDRVRLSAPGHRFENIDICDAGAVVAAVQSFRPDTIMHLAAETHVDRSIDGPAAFLQTNIIGTFNLLEASLAYWRGLDGDRRDGFRFHHISTDEVYGDLEPDDPPFTEATPYAPSSPYSASKAASDHLVRAWHRTYGLPVLLSNCSNNYGPRQFPEKLIPLMILNAVAGRPLPVYGDGLQRRDWLFVEDHAHALHLILQKGRVGETYNVGGLSERTNIEVVRSICDTLDELCTARPAGIARFADLITSVADRPGHDRRYAIDCAKLERELGWQPRETFETGLRRTVQWYLANLDWCERVRGGSAAENRVGLRGAAR